MLFYEPKLLKSGRATVMHLYRCRFSALLRAEIVEITPSVREHCRAGTCFSALLRAEIVEILPNRCPRDASDRFSALLRAEIVEICVDCFARQCYVSFSALLRAEIVEIGRRSRGLRIASAFQCSSTSRNC